MEQYSEFDLFIASLGIEVVEHYRNEGLGTIANAFDSYIAGLLTNKIKINIDYLDIDKVENGKFNNEQLLALTKAGTYIRYAEDNFGIADIDSSLAVKDIILEAITQKKTEDTPSEESMEEIEKLMEETEEELENVEKENNNFEIEEGEDKDECTDCD